MRVKPEGVFKMHNEDDDALLPISFNQRRHEQPPLDVNLASMIKHWRLKERVRAKKKIVAKVDFLIVLILR